MYTLHDGEHTDTEYKDLIVYNDATGNIAFKICLKEVTILSIYLVDNILCVLLNDGSTKNYPLRNHDPLHNFNFSVR